MARTFATTNPKCQLAASPAQATTPTDSRLPLLERLLGRDSTEDAQENAERLYRLLWETTTDAVLIIDANSVIRFANPSTMGIFGYLPESLINQPLERLQPERIRRAHIEGMSRYLQCGERRADWRAVETVGMHANGVEFPLELAFSEIVLETTRLFVAFARDITVRKHAEAALLAEKELAETTLGAIGDAVISTDAAGVVVFLNQMAESLTGWPREQAVGQSIRCILDLVDEASGDSLSLAADLLSPRLGLLPIPPGALLRSFEGTQAPIEGTTAPIVGRSGAYSGCVVAFRDVSVARELAEQVSYQARHDALTGLPNRGAFEMFVRKAIGMASASRHGYSLLYLDVDQFRILNDTCGHIAGDQLLRHVAGVLTLILGPSDVLARLGGDEFGVLLAESGPEAGVRVAESLRRAVAGSIFSWDDRNFSTTVSIGHVHFNDDQLSLTDILSKADEACYGAKDEGRDRVRSYQVGDEALELRHGEMEWVGLIREALAENRFVLFAQPIVSVHGGDDSLLHFEFLLRMHDRSGKLVLPMSFIPAAERYGLMPLLDRWVIRAVAEQVGARLRMGGVTDKACFAVNLSGASLADAELPRYIASCLRDAMVPAEIFCFEITETAAIGNLTSASKLIKDVKKLGCKFSLDDFGSGMSSFSYLKQLPVDYLKIDGSFIRDIATDAIDRAIVVSINEIGHLMGLRTVAEFVEDEDVLRELLMIGVDYAQGYHTGRPAPWQSF